MEKEWLSPEEPVPPPKPSLAEEQRRAFEEDQKRIRRPTLSLRWPGQIFRN